MARVHGSIAHHALNAPKGVPLYCVLSLMSVPSP
jgi:hypothetical protein